jgi:hypothetical protein
MIVEQDEISQTFDKSWIGKEIQDPDLLEQIGQVTLDYMLERVSGGKGLGGVTFVPNKYSDKYIESAAFQAAGKSPRPVNMLLNGDMLGSIEVVTEGTSVKLVIPSDQAPKAHGHQTGEGFAPKRPFFGVTREEFNKNILSKFKDEIREASRPRSRQPSLFEGLGIEEEIATLGDLFRLAR